MKRGYRFPADPDSWESLRSEFEWQIPDTYNIAEVVEHGAPDDTALAHVDADGGKHRLSYGNLERAVREVAAHLADVGVGRGDRVALCLPQSPELLVGYLATFAQGAVAVPLSMVLGEGAIEHAIEDSDATTLLVDAWKANRLDDSSTSAVSQTITVETGAVGYDDSPSGGLPADGSGNRSLDYAETAPDDPALILYTSGTTGEPKGVVQGHQYLIGSSPAYQCYFHLFDPADARAARVWSPSEWAWAGALFNVVFPTLSFGGTVVSRARYEGFDPETALETVERTGVTHAFLPPTALRKIRDGATPSDYDLSSLSVAQCGGEKLPPSLFSWGEDALSIRINEAYGQTEANGLIGNCQALFETRPGSIGRPYPGHDVLVVDDGGEACEAGEQGELAVRTPDPVLFEGYLDNPSATAERYDDGLFRTGDAAVVDESGYLWHRGRLDDLIITSGYRVSPFEVERVLKGVDAVRDAVVGGVPDDERGQRIKAFVVASDSDAPTAEFVEELKQTVRDSAGAHKVPREVEIVDDLPTTSSGKTNRSLLFDEESRSDGDRE